MKKLTATVLLLVLASCYLLSCEKDDICPEGTVTTPSMVIEIFNAENRSVARAVDSLRLFIEGREDTIRLGSTSKFRLPLLVDAENVKWGLKQGTRVTGNHYIYNIDYLEFTYTKEEEYINRACGFKDSFRLVPGTNLVPNPTLTNGPGAEGLWIDDIDVETSNIINENETHIKIYY
ncbi:DUF6452 family protein [Flavobacterium rhizosphaerae]|uniref:DUF6452 family protein n=1 Tax=Flavobacterium rhizosphaerae TaxID=3163298 RepID=A0ABW8YSZ1_9FLAO